MKDNFKRTKKRGILRFVSIYLFLFNIVYPSNNLTTKKDWSSFKDEHSIKNVYIVYAGPYPSSPSSSFGHLFLLLEPSCSKPLLLWDAIDFSANVNNVGAFEKFYMGIFGGLYGTYKIIPFYEKLREYTFIESRPLWLFPFDISKSESDILLHNIFEFKKSKYPYRFHDKNCASQIENLLRISIDTDTITNNIMVSPRKVLAGLENRTKQPLYIESVENVVNKNFNIVSEKLNRTNNLRDSEAIILLNILEWKYSRKKRHLTIDEERQIEALKLRASTSKKKESINLRKFKKDFYIHPPMLLGGGIKYLNNQNTAYSILYRFGLHEFYENSNVFPEYDFLSAINIDIGLRNNKIEINKLMLFEQLSLQPRTPLSKYLSWKLSFGAVRKYEFSKSLIASGLFGGIGYTYSIFNKYLKMSFLLDFEPVYLENLNFTVLTGPELISRINLSHTIKWMGKFGGTINTFEDLDFHYFVESDLAFELSQLTNLLFKIKYAKNYFSIGLQVLLYIN